MANEGHRSRAAPNRLIGIIDLAGRCLGRLGTGFECATEPTWAPDGRANAFAARHEGSYDIHLVPAP